METTAEIETKPLTSMWKNVFDTGGWWVLLQDI